MMSPPKGGSRSGPCPIVLMRSKEAPDFRDRLPRLPAPGGLFLAFGPEQFGRKGSEYPQSGDASKLTPSLRPKDAGREQ